jgi:hypothetical protein
MLEPPEFLTAKPTELSVLFCSVVAPPSAIVATVVELSLKSAILPVLVELLTFKASPVVLPVSEVKAEVTVSVLVAATVVLPFKLTAPVPVVNVLAPEMEVFWARTIDVAVVVPILRAPADALSSNEVSIEVVPCTVPVVVMLSAPVSMAPKPEDIAPAFRVPVPVMAVATASLMSTRAASWPSR